MKIFINGRFKKASITGVQRYASEVIKNLKTENLLLEPVVSSSLGGHFWEQFILPHSIPKDGLLWCPANTGPMFMRNQVVTIHDASVMDNPQWFSKSFVAFYRMMWKGVTENSRYIITDSEFSRKRLVHFYPNAKKKIVSIPLGVSEEFSSVYTKPSGKLDREDHRVPKYILSLGSLESRKNLRSLFMAWEAWEDRPQGLILIVAGGKGKNFSSIGFDRVPAGVELVGRIDDRDLPDLYAGAFAFVFPSFYEGFGLPPLEAMAAGIPVICSNATSLPEVLGNACLYIDPQQPITILHALKKLVANPQMCEELSVAGKERAQLFTWKRTAELTEQILLDSTR